MRGMCRVHVGVGFLIAAGWLLWPTASNGDYAECMYDPGGFWHIPADVDEVCLLRLFQPWLQFESHSMHNRSEYPISILYDGDLNVENNFAINGPSVYSVYAEAQLRYDMDGHPYWLLMYHYYYAKNWHPRVSEWDGSGNGFSHEHDWEWIYVIVGYSRGLPEVGEAFVGYAAVLSCHSEDNLKAMAGSSICPLTLAAGCKPAKRTFLFPRVTNEVSNGSFGVVSSSRKLGWWDEYVPGWGLPKDLQVVQATVSAKGNQFDPNWTPGATGYKIEGDATGISTLEAYTVGTTCTGGTLTGEMYYGDPGVSGDLMDRLKCHDFLGSPEECDDVRLNPWKRDNMGPLGGGIPEEEFDMPYNGYIQTTLHTAGAAGEPIATVERTNAGWTLRWFFSGDAMPQSFEIIGRGHDNTWKCDIGKIEPREVGWQEVVIGDPLGGGESGIEPGKWILDSHCLRADEMVSGELEVWAEWVEGRRELLARVPLEATASDAPPLRVDVVPNPVLKECRVGFSLPAPGHARIEVVDLSGRCVRVIEEMSGRKGWNEIIWDGCDAEGRPVDSGVHWVRVVINGSRSARRILVLR